MKKKTILGATLGCLTGICGISYEIAIRIFSSVALDRTPRINMMGNGPKSELTGLAKDGQDWLHAHDHHTCDMFTREGFKLKCHYFPCDNAKRTVIEFHGWHSCWDRDFSASSPFLHEMGCNLLIVEQRGQGSSEGSQMTFGLKERYDLIDCVKWYQNKINSNIPIYLAGVSMGATTVLMASSEHFPPQVKGIMADCGFTSPYDIIRIVGKKRFHIPEHPFMDSINFYCKRKYGLDLRGWSSIDAVRSATVPILFVHGNADTFVPYEMSVQAYEECTSDKDILIVDGAEHGMSFLVNQAAYTEKAEKLFQHDHD